MEDPRRGVVRGSGMELRLQPRGSSCDAGMIVDVTEPEEGSDLLLAKELVTNRRSVGGLSSVCLLRPLTVLRVMQPY